MSKIGALLRRTFGIAKQHMGTDTFGNKYYYIPEQKTWTGRTIRAKRLVEPVNAKEYEYQEGSIPSNGMPGFVEEERSHLLLRDERPAKQFPNVGKYVSRKIKELLKNERYREQVKFRAKEVEEKEMLIQANEYEEGLVARPAQTQIKGHASAPHYREEQLSAEPSSTANTFQPGSWTPPKDQSTKA